MTLKNFDYPPFEGILQGEGINFSDEYSFKVRRSGKEYRLTGKKRHNVKPLSSDPYYDYRFLNGIKVIVGENGTGKTTLLRTIMQDGCPFAQVDKKPSYEMAKGRNAYIMVIAIGDKVYARYSLPKSLNFDTSELDESIKVEMKFISALLTIYIKECRVQQERQSLTTLD